MPKGSNLPERLVSVDLDTEICGSNSAATLCTKQEMAKQPFAIVGESSGGNLALALMLRAHQEELSLPRAAALVSPWCNLNNIGDSLDFDEDRDPTLTARNSFLAARYYAVGNDLNHPEIPPLNGAFDNTFPPCVITTGTRDLLLSQSAALAQRFRDADINVDLQVWEGLWHVFEWYDDLPKAGKSLTEIANHLSRHMTK